MQCTSALHTFELNSDTNACLDYVEPPRSCSALAQGDERIEDQSIEGQALAKRTFAGAKLPAPRDADFVDAGLARRRLDPVNQLRHLPIENIRYPEEVGPKGDEQVAALATVAFSALAPGSLAMFTAIRRAS
jgi:hypothetical protein